MSGHPVIINYQQLVPLVDLLLLVMVHVKPLGGPVLLNVPAATVVDIRPHAARSDPAMLYPEPYDHTHIHTHTYTHTPSTLRQQDCHSTPRLLTGTYHFSVSFVCLIYLTFWKGTRSKQVGVVIIDLTLYSFSFSLPFHPPPFLLLFLHPHPSPPLRFTSRITRSSPM